jgi:DNA-directed RNA polymerase II subunit RPB1
LNDDIGTIAKATFEVHTEVFLNASRHADIDYMRGVSANVMTGQPGYYGTNSFNIVLDLKEMKKLSDAVVSVKDKNTEIDELFGTFEESSDYCSKKNITIKNNISNIKQNNIGICDDGYNVF